MKRYKLFVFFLIAVFTLLPVLAGSVQAYGASEAATASSEVTMKMPDEDTEILSETYSDIEIVSSPAETASESASAQGSVKGIIEFMVLWSVVYVIIRYVRYRQGRNKPF